MRERKAALLNSSFLLIAFQCCKSFVEVAKSTNVVDTNCGAISLCICITNTISQK